MSIQSGNLEEFLTVAEVAEMLRLNQQTVRNWIDQGSLPAHRVGRRVRIRRSDLDRMLDEGYTVRTDSADGSPDQASGRSTGETADSAGTATATANATDTATGPTAEDFWGGELADPWDGTPTAVAP